MLIRFVGEIFSPYICTNGPGEDPFEAVMCAVGAASQISCLLMEDSIFNTKYHLKISAGIIIKRFIESATL